MIVCRCGAKAALIPSSPTSSWLVRTREVVTGTPENTGVSSVDHNSDRVLGEESRRAWTRVQGRYDKKRKILRDNPGAVGEDLTITPEGGYSLMSSEESQLKHSTREDSHSRLREKTN